MKLILFFLIMFSSIGVSGQQMVKCGVGLVNYKPLKEKIAISDNSNFIARTKWGKRVKLYQLGSTDYKYIGDIELIESLPMHMVISNKGDLITYGENRLFLTGKAQSDIVYIYENKGKTVKKINAEMVFSKKEIQESILEYEKSYECTPVKPWICHSEKPSLSSDNELKIIDTLNREVTINLNTMKIDLSEPYEECSLFNSDT